MSVRNGLMRWPRTWTLERLNGGWRARTGVPDLKHSEGAVADQYRAPDHGEGLFEALGISPLLGLAILFALWCLITWYLWTGTRHRIEERLASWNESKAHKWRTTFPWIFGVWVIYGLVWFVAALVRAGT